MTAQTFTAQGTVNATLREITLTVAGIEVAAGLVAGSATATLATLDIASVVGALATNGPDLTPAWENSGRAVVVELDDHELVVPGPNHSSSSLRDTEEPYTWIYPSSVGVAAFVQAVGGGTHTFTVTLDDGVDADDEEPPPTPPAPGVSSPISGGDVGVSWVRVARDGGGYDIQRRTGATGSWATIASDQSGTSYTDPDLAPGTYHYRLRAANSEGEHSAWSVASAAATVPEPPSTTVTANAGADKSVASGGTVRLDGSATVQNGQGATTWAWRRVSGSGGSLDSATAQRPTFTAPTLSAGAANRPIVYELVATNNGVASAGDRVTVTVTAPDAPPALAAPVLSGTADDGAVDTYWTAVTGATGYQRRHKRSSSQSWGSWAAAGDDRTQRFRALVNGVSYDFQVRAIATGQEGTPSNTLTLTPVAAAPPPPRSGGVEASRLDAGPIVDLFTVRLQGGAVERYTSGPHGSVSVRYGGVEYRPLPITLEGADFRAAGAFSRPTLRVSQLDRAAAPVDWQGATIERVRTLGRYLDGASEADSDRHWPLESWVVDRLAGRGREELSWQLSSPLDLQLAMVPRRQVLRDVCQWEYRRRVGGQWVNPPADDGCPYRGNRYWNAQDESVANAAQDVCSRRLSGCKLRFGEHGDLPFGGFAGVSQLRR